MYSYVDRGFCYESKNIFLISFGLSHTFFVHYPPFILYFVSFLFYYFVTVYIYIYFFFLSVKNRYYR